MTRQPSGTSINGWRLFITAHAALVERIDHELAAAGVIPLQWYDVLVELAQAPEQRRRMYELADAVVLSKSSLSRLIDRLEAEGMLRREPAPDDRRGAFAVLTDAGQAALEAARLRLRPILMTSIAFIMGVVPLVLSSGAGAEMRHAIGIAVFSGMLGVTFFGLFLTPLFYVLLRAAVLQRRRVPARIPNAEGASHA